MLFVKPLSEDEIISLKSMNGHHPHHMSGVRASSIILSNKGYSVNETADIHGVCRQSAANWINSRENAGIAGLSDKPRSGRPRRLSEDIEKKVIEIVKEEPRSLKRAAAKLKERFNIKNISISAIKRICKRAGLTWKRIRKSLKNRKNTDEYEKVKKTLENLIEREENGEMELYYFDESGVSLEPYIPYAWQPANEHIEAPSSKSRRLNMLGFINKKCDFESYAFEGGVNSAAVIACFDEFAKTAAKDAYVFIDNAPARRSGEFKQHIEQWREKCLFAEFNAPYSPELNIIEILWRKIKYEWMPFSAYESYESLKEGLFNILRNIGNNKDYKIEFT